MQEITSLQNPTVKELVRLTAQRRARQERGLFLAESPKLAAEAALAGVPVRTLYATPDALERYRDTLAPALAAAGEVVAISRPVAEKLAREAMIGAAHEETDGGVIVSLSLADGKGELLSLRLL